MPASALSGVFEQATLSYEAYGEGETTDPWGNTVPVTTSEELVVSLQASASPALAERFGADDVTVVFKGQAVNPAIVPDAVQVGKAFDLTFRGRAGTLTLQQVQPRKLRTVDEALGQRFVATWRPS